MSELELTLQDTAGNSKALTLPRDVIIKDLIPAIRDLLILPRTDSDGHEITYAAFHNQSGRFLNDTLSFYGNNVGNGDSIRILPCHLSQHLELELTSEPNIGMRYPVPPREVTIGREFQNDIVIRHKNISRQHGVFEWRDGFHVYYDLNSANGTWINHQAVRGPFPMASGARISLGEKVHLIYRARKQASDAATSDADNAMAGMDISGSFTGLVPMPDGQVYVCHSPRQTTAAEQIIKTLRMFKQIRVWSYGDIAPGSNYYETIQTALRKSNVMVVIFSDHALKSEDVHNEWRYFYQHDKAIIPITVGDCELPRELAHLTPIPFEQEPLAFNRTLVAALTRVL